MTRWLLLRGWTREAAHWGSFPDIMRAAMPGASVHCLDLPGAGARHREASPASIPAIVEATRDAAPAGELRRPFHLFGLSMGGMVAIEWARRHPAEVAGLVLVNTSARPYCALHRRLRPAALRRLLAIGFARDARLKERAIYRLTSHDPVPREDVIDDWSQVRSLRPVSGTNALCQLLAAARYRAPGRPPCERVLVMSSAGDHIVHPGCSAALARAWGATAVTHPSAGHDLPLDDGPWVARETARWLRS